MTLFSLGFSIFALIICTIALIINVKDKDIRWIILMAACIAFNSVFFIIHLKNYLEI
jgi:hypothetical protein